jgi:very-short-patch-repair endonuclease
MPIEPSIADFACPEHRLVVELDGEYHDHTYEHDLIRQKRLEALGWRVLRFRNEDVLEDVESVAIAIARFLGLESQLNG